VRKRVSSIRHDHEHDLEGQKGTLTFNSCMCLCVCVCVLEGDMVFVLPIDDERMLIERNWLVLNVQ